MLILSACASYGTAPLPASERILGEPTPSGLLPMQRTHPALVAQAIDLDLPLSDLDVARLTLVSSPELAALRTHVGVSQAQLLAAGLLPDPQLSLSLDRPQGAGLVNALGADLGLELSALYSRSNRVAAARETVNQSRLDLAWSEWLALNQARLLVRRVLALEAQLALAVQADRLSAELHQLSTTALQRGDARLDDTALYLVGYLDTHDRLLELRRQCEGARGELNALLGLPPQTLLALAPASAPRALDGLQGSELIADAVKQRLDLRALQAGYAAQEQGLKAALKMALPLPQLNLNRARDTGAIWTSGFAVGLSLPLWNRNRGDIAINLASREQLAAEYRVRVLQVRADVAAQLRELQSLDQARRELAELLPQLQLAEQVTRQASGEGNLALTTFETLRAALLDKQLRLLALAQAQAEAEVALETAAGRLLWE